MKDLEQKHEQLKLVTFAMWQMLKSHTGLTDGELDNRVANVEAGKKCMICSHKVPKNSTRCLYCGEENSNYEILF